MRLSIFLLLGGIFLSKVFFVSCGSKSESENDNESVVETKNGDEDGEVFSEDSVVKVFYDGCKEDKALSFENFYNVNKVTNLCEGDDYERPLICRAAWDKIEDLWDKDNSNSLPNHYEDKLVSGEFNHPLRYTYVLGKYYYKFLSKHVQFIDVVGERKIIKSKDCINLDNGFYKKLEWNNDNNEVNEREKEKFYDMYRYTTRWLSTVSELLRQRKGKKFTKNNPQDLKDIEVKNGYFYLAGQPVFLMGFNGHSIPKFHKATNAKLLKLWASLDANTLPLSIKSESILEEEPSIHQVLGLINTVFSKKGALGNYVPIVDLSFSEDRDDQLDNDNVKIKALQLSSYKPLDVISHHTKEHLKMNRNGDGEFPLVRYWEDHLKGKSGVSGIFESTKYRDRIRLVMLANEPHFRTKPFNPFDIKSVDEREDWQQKVTNLFKDFSEMIHDDIKPLISDSLYTHIKVANKPFFRNRNKTGGWGASNLQNEGIDYPKLSKHLDLMGFDTRPVYLNKQDAKEFAPDYAFMWRDMSQAYDMAKSLDFDKPIYDSELHIVDTVQIDNSLVPMNHMARGLWFAYIQGLAGHLTWYWNEAIWANKDNWSKEKLEWMGASLLTQPWLIDRHSRVMRTLNEHALKIKRMQKSPRIVSIVYDNKMALASKDYLPLLRSIHENLALSGSYVHYIDSRNVGGFKKAFETDRIKQMKLMVVPVVEKEALKPHVREMKEKLLTVLAALKGDIDLKFILNNTNGAVPLKIGTESYSDWAEVITLTTVNLEEKDKKWLRELALRKVKSAHKDNLLTLTDNNETLAQHSLYWRYYEPMDSSHQENTVFFIMNLGRSAIDDLKVNIKAGWEFNNVLNPKKGNLTSGDQNITLQSGSFLFYKAEKK